MHWLESILAPFGPRAKAIPTVEILGANLDGRRRYHRRMRILHMRKLAAISVSGRTHPEAWK